MKNTIAYRAALIASAIAMSAFAATAAQAQTAEAPPVIDSDADTAQTPTREGSALDGNYLTIGAGAAFVPSYDGSDDYVITPVPLVQGSLLGVAISPRPGGVALDLIDDGDRPGVHFSAGPAFRLRSNRTGDVKDEVVALLPERETAIEVGPSVGLSVPGVLHGFDSLSFTVDARWDVAGAHEGMTVSPSVSYTTPLSMGTVAILGLSAEYADDSFADYYYSITPADSLASGLPVFDADGGFRSAGATLLVGQDLNGNVLDGGLSLFAIGGYSRLLGDAAETPITSQRGSRDQWLGGLGLGYTF
jgi:outer membrane scaffolding protein for murein synthesis (MipA/OmpV family)